MVKNKLPLDGLKGLKENFQSDATSGFIVFLLALPLSLGIAKASEFPPIMGLLTAIIGGMLVSLFMGSRLSIKGPAAGLIVIVAGSVAELGHGDNYLGWKLALGAMVVAGLLQILFGVLKLGKLADFFPLSAVHGMLAAIGIIIIAKQVPVMLNVAPEVFKGNSPIELLIGVPKFVFNMDLHGAIIGVVSLLIMLLWPKIKNKSIKMIPAALVVLIVAIPLQLFFNFKNTQPDYALLTVGRFVDNLGFHASFDGISQTGTFIKFVIMFALVGSLESLLTVKAVDLLDPYKRKTNMDQDLIAVGIGNTFAAFFGGIPMISEVARSSANVANGAQTRWANFFHGLFILLFLLVASPLLEMIPNAALAAMLVSVGIKLAHPTEFKHMLEIGKEHLIVFIVTILVTLLEDLLLGILAGVIVNILLNLKNGMTSNSIFKGTVEVSDNEEQIVVTIANSANFTNYIGLKKQLDKLPEGKKVIVDFSNAKMVDHSVLANLEGLVNDYNEKGSMVLKGLEEFKKMSKHPLADLTKK